MTIGIDVTPLTLIETGVERYLLQLVRSLSRIDTQTPYTVFINAKDAGRFACLSSNFMIAPIGMRGRIGRFIAQQLMVPIMIRSRGIRVLHSPSFFIPYCGGKTKHVLTIHDMTMFTLAKCHTYFRHSYFFLRGVRDSIRRADRIIVPSAFVRSEIARLLPNIGKDKIQVTPHGVDPEFQPADRFACIPERLNKLRPYILFVGTIEPRKNLPMLLEAYRIARMKHGLRENLVLVGRRGWKYGEVEKMLQLEELRSRVHAVGYVDRRDLLHYYQYASVYVCPSIEEGFGFSPLEAMACGIPTIATDTSSLKENLSGAAKIVPIADVQALADAVTEVLSRSDMAADLSHRGLTRAREFSWENTARKTLECYQELNQRAI